MTSRRMTAHPGMPEYVQLLEEVAKSVVDEAGTQLRACRESGRNYLGDDLDEATLAQIAGVVGGGDRGDLDDHAVAQLHELAFWRWVAFEGYCGKDPRAFPWFQRVFMTSVFMRTGWSFEALEESTLAEVGCGPLGMIEFLPGRRKVGYDPLNPHYARLFAAARRGGVEYVGDLTALVEEQGGTFDLGICFNVIDHTSDPKAILDATMRLVRPGGRFLLQVNTVRPGEPSSPAHRSMHPSPVEADTVRAWLREYAAWFDELLEDEPTAENEYFYMAWGYKDGD